MLFDVYIDSKLDLHHTFCLICDACDLVEAYNHFIFLDCTEPGKVELPDVLFLQ